MTMLAALQRALELGAYARPAGVPHYAHRYVPQGRDYLIRISAQDRRGRVREEFWRTLSKREMEDDWILCDAAGQEIDPSVPFRDSGPTLRDLYASMTKNLHL